MKLKFWLLSSSGLTNPYLAFEWQTVFYNPVEMPAEHGDNSAWDKSGYDFGRMRRDHFPN